MSFLIQSASRLAINSLKTSVFSCSRFNAHRYKTSYEGDGKSTANILNFDVDLGLMIDAISTVGFRLNNGTTVIGSFALFHRSILSWNVKSAAHINPESLSLFKVLEPKVDFVVIGLGDPEDVLKHSSRIMRICKEMNLNVEMLPTESACSTFNFLNSEGRNIAALLIPPGRVMMSEDDLVSAQLNLEKAHQDNPNREGMT